MTVASVIRKTPIATLRTYFDARRIDLSGSINWQDDRTPSAQRLIKAVGNLKDGSHEIIAMDFNRIQGMSDEAGQASIAGVVQDPNVLHSFENSYDRAMWLFLKDENSFKRAEEVRFAEHYRQGQKWDGFVGPKGMAVNDDDERRQELETRICEMFMSMNALVDVYKRLRAGSDKSSSLITQVVIYREGFPDSVMEFEQGSLERKPRRPVLEAVLTYDSKSGDIEVVGLDTKDRPRLVRLFAQIMLGQGIIGMRVPLRQYDLSSLVVQRTFQTDREDGIASVKVIALKIHLHACPGVWFMLGKKRNDDANIYEYSDDPSRGGHILRQADVEIVYAKLAVRFRPDRETRSGKSITLGITLPNGCDLKGRTEKERLICEKYLSLWGLVKEV